MLFMLKEVLCDVAHVKRLAQSERLPTTRFSGVIVVEQRVNEACNRSDHKTWRAEP